MNLFVLCVELSLLLIQGWLGDAHLRCRLVAVAMITRHGNRAPHNTYPLDPHKDYKWPNGLGGLTTLGEQQMVEIGKILAERYSTRFNTHRRCHSSSRIGVVNLSKVYAQSSASPRCVISANYLLDGLLQIPIPANFVYVAPTQEDEILTMPGKPCPKYDDSVYGSFSFDDDNVKKIIDISTTEGRHIISYIKNNTGLTDLNPESLTMLGDALSIQKANGLELPIWTESVLEQYLIPMAKLSLDKIGSSQFLAIRSGVLLRTIMEKLRYATQRSTNPNMILYSGHDATIAGMMFKLGIRDQFPFTLAYASALTIEIYDNRRFLNDFEIRIYYFRNHQDKKPLRFHIPDCPTPCSLKQFLEIVEPQFTLDYNQACTT